MKKFRKLSEELTPSSKPEPGRESVGGRFSSGAPLVTSEAKDEEEYGYEGDMAMNQLKTIIRHSEYLMDMLKPDTDLPEWVQSKITLAADYIQTSCDYMTSEMNESKEAGDDPTGDTPSPNLGLKKGKTVASGSVTEATSAAVRMQRALEKIRQSREDSEKRAKELLKPTPKNEDADPCWKGYKMVGMKNKNGRQVPNCVPGEGVPAMKKEEIVQEGRPSQRHPLEGHEYHKKSDEALVHIAKDAHAAAEAMKGHNTTAENKYRDQANDSATVRHFRKTSGMPDWYKKKYGHMKEAFKPMDEPNFNLSIQARQKKADENKNTSTVKNIAKQAMKKQVSKMSVKESLEESRKAEIVKDILKKGKKSNDSNFEPEPVLGTTVVKADN